MKTDPAHLIIDGIAGASAIHLVSEGKKYPQVYEKGLLPSPKIGGPDGAHGTQAVGFFVGSAAINYVLAGLMYPVFFVGWLCAGLWVANLSILPGFKFFLWCGMAVLIAILVMAPISRIVWGKKIKQPKAKCPKTTEAVVNGRVMPLVDLNKAALSTVHNQTSSLRIGSFSDTR